MSPTASALLVQEIAPRIRSSMNAVPAVGSDDHEELAQDAIATAAGLLDSAERRGKSVTAGNVAYYAVRLTRQGRRSTGYHRTDALHPAAHIHGNACTVAVDGPAGPDDTEASWSGVLASEVHDPARAVACKLDWEGLNNRLDGIARAILHCLAEERPLTEVAAGFGLSRSAIQSHKHRLSRAVCEYLGAEALQDIAQPPQWTLDLRAIRERLACRAGIRDS
jgi:DNA-directed RNA polymerase specialized sigma24 family protein